MASEKKRNINRKKGRNGVFIIIPGLNEEKHIGGVVAGVRKQGFRNIVFVDDGSWDGSSAAAGREGAEVLRHVVNLGKGAAAKTGCDYALERGAKVIVLMDADGQHRPEDVPRLLAALKGKNADVVFGYRKLDSNMPPVMRFGNWGINAASRLVNGLALKDTQSGFRCMTADAYRKVRWQSSNYSMESEMIAGVAKHGLKYAQVPIATIYHDKFKGTTIADGIKVFINIIRFRLFRGKK
jgi:glycosyltransferase involved in cell wall biosynthesis